MVLRQPTLAFGLTGLATNLLRQSAKNALPTRSLPKRSRPLCTSSAAAAAAAAKKRVVFLGTPTVAAQTLQKLCAASTHPSSTFSVTGVVTQPPAPVGRKRLLTKSPVHALAEELAIPSVLTPSSARDAGFLAQLRALQPHLCVTAAYGNFLPRAFLDIPPFGTLNIHPSLLPAWRGAAPVPRALEAGVRTTGVSILFTVLKMDAGPVLAVRERELRGDEYAPALLEELFRMGADALLEVLPAVWDGSVDKVDQDEALASHAEKLSKEEGRLTFTQNAQIVHNKVRAFAGWPGTWADFVMRAGKGEEEVRLKVVETTVIRDSGGMCLGVHDVVFDEERGCLGVTCDDGSKIGVLKVQPLGKNVMDAQSFWNGLRGRSVTRKRVPH